MSKILFLTQESKIHIFKLPCNFFYIDQKIINIFSSKSTEHDVIDTLTSEDMENMPLGSHIFSSKTLSCVYNNVEYYDVGYKLISVCEIHFT